jgi:hypothetical protein
MIAVALMAIVAYNEQLYLTVPLAEAGKTGNQREKKRPPRRDDVYLSNIKDADGNPINSDDYLVLSANGGCMEKVGIKNGDLLLAEQFKISDSKRVKSERITPGDILVIYLFSLLPWKYRGYKIRLLKEVVDNKASTYYFANDTLRPSSKPHSLSKVVGIVRHHVPPPPVAC